MIKLGLLYGTFRIRHCSKKRSIRLWKEDKEIASYNINGDIYGVSLSIDERLITVNYRHPINGSRINSIWHLREGK